MYEGRTRGKRQRYNFDDEEDFYSDGLPTRRSGRQSGRDSPAAPSGPTVTASGRQVKSRATGLYGETLLSGQATDRASPATGDYVRSDVSEEPRQGRSTRAGNRAAADGRSSRRAVDSEEDDDATSWDGGDEDEDEPEQMDLDDDDEEEDVAEDEDEDDQEPQSLMVTLRYRKGDSDPPKNGPASNGVSHPAVLTNGVNDVSHQPPSAILPSQQPEQSTAPTVPSAAPLSAILTSTSEPATHIQQNDIDSIVPAVQVDVAATNKLDPPPAQTSFAPTPPYGAVEEVPTPQQSVKQPPVPTSLPFVQQPQKPAPAPQPAANPAASWQ